MTTNLEKLPSWFSISSYKGTESFKPEDWYINILARLEPSYIEELENGILESPLVERVPTDVLDRTHGPTLQHASAMELSVRDARYICSQTKDLQDLIDTEDYWDERMWEEDFGLPIKDKIGANRFNDLSSSQEFDAMYRSPFVTRYPIMEDWIDSESYIRINLQAKDKEILADIQALLVELRAREKEQLSNAPIASNLKTVWLKGANLDKWRTYEILAYIDLTNWAKVNNINLPYHFLGKALFPKVYDTDITDRVRRTVKPLADYARTDFAINALRLKMKKHV